MANKMERFTDETRQLLMRTQEFAEELQHPLIEPEHMLLAMTDLKNCEMYGILADEGITLEKLKPFVRSRFPNSQAPTNLELSVATKKMFESSVDMARRKGHYKLHSSHFLAAFVRLKYSGTETTLAHFQVEAKAITKALEAFWDKYPRLTQETSAVLREAEGFAEALEHTLLEPEHILLAMTKFKDLEVCKILEDEGIILEKLLPFVRNRLPKGWPLANPISVPTQKTLELAFVVAKGKEHGDIDTTHLLMALLQVEYQGIREILSHFQADDAELKLALERYWNSDAVIGRKIRWARAREIGFWEILRQSFGFGEKKKKR